MRRQRLSKVRSQVKQKLIPNLLIRFRAQFKYKLSPRNIRKEMLDSRSLQPRENWLTQVFQDWSSSRQMGRYHFSGDVKAETWLFRHALFVPQHCERQIKAWRIRHKLLSKALQRTCRVKKKALSPGGDIKIQIS